MGAAFGAGTGAGEFTVLGYLIGFSLGQLVWGPIGDRYGRRMPVALGLVMFGIGSAGCAMAGGITTMIGWRIAQALGACASVVLAQAMVRDLYQGDRAAQMMSMLMTVMAIGPLVGPLVGGQILGVAGWRAIFLMLVIVGIATLGALFTLNETLPENRRNHEPLKQAFARYATLLRDPRLLALGGKTADKHLTRAELIELTRVLPKDWIPSSSASGAITTSVNSLAISAAVAPSNGRLMATMPPKAETGSVFSA